MAVKFRDENNVYVWLENLKYENNFLTGTLSETGLEKKIHNRDVIDWMLIKNGRLIGGYTIRYYRNGLSKDKKINFDIDFGVKIDAGNDFFNPDLSTPEGALITLENFYSEQSLEDALSCKNFDKESKNVLLELAKDLKEEFIKETAELLKSAFIEDLQQNGMPNFENIERVFKRLAYNGKEKMQLIEEILIYPDGKEESNKFWIAEDENGKWKVLNMVN
jgi:hypothetical protein